MGARLRRCGKGSGVNEEVAILVAYLWFAGGVGWAHAYELQKERAMNPMAKAVVVVLFPFLFAISAAEDLIATWRGE